MALTIKQKQAIRDGFMDSFKAFFHGQGEDVLQVATNALAMPWAVDGEEGFIKVTFQIPTGSRDGDPFDGYEEETNFLEEQAEKAEKAKAKAEAKAKKIKRDNKDRDLIKENKRKEKMGR